jgi:hypothetical protein
MNGVQPPPPLQPMGAHEEGPPPTRLDTRRNHAPRGTPAPKMARGPPSRQRPHHRVPRRATRRTRRGHRPTRSRPRRRLSRVVCDQRSPPPSRPQARISDLLPARVARAGRLSARQGRSALQAARAPQHTRMGQQVLVLSPRRHGVALVRHPRSAVSSGQVR